MPKIIEAVYENGVFKLLQKVDLKEGEKVRIRISNIVGKTRGIIAGSKIEEIIEEIESEGILWLERILHHLANTRQKATELLGRVESGEVVGYVNDVVILGSNLWLSSGCH